MSYRKYRMARRGARAVTLVAVAGMILVGIEAGARAQEAGSQPEQQKQKRGPATVADGVTVSGVQLAGLTGKEAKRELKELAARPVVVTFRSRTWRYSPRTLGARADVGGAVQAALAAPEGTSLALPVDVNRKQLRRWSRSFARSFDVKRVDAEIVLHDLKPRATRAVVGRKLSRKPAEAALAASLEGSSWTPVQLPVRILQPRVTRRDVGLAVVIKRASNRLILYRPGKPRGKRVVRKFGVATGLASYPTPLGNFEIVSMQENPWWRPPDSDWAEGAEPIPPGPGNPLGTRWMGLSVPAIGIHGTPDAASIGYSASHGCIRMHVPEAEWLFERVEPGTPVYIVDA